MPTAATATQTHPGSTNGRSRVVVGVVDLDARQQLLLVVLGARGLAHLRLGLGLRLRRLLLRHVDLVGRRPERDPPDALERHLDPRGHVAADHLDGLRVLARSPARSPSRPGRDSRGGGP